MGQGGDEQAEGEEDGDVEQRNGDEPEQAVEGVAAHADGAGQIHIGDAGQQGHQKRHGEAEVPADPLAEDHLVAGHGVGQGDLEGAAFLFAADGVEDEDEGQQADDDVDDVAVVRGGEQGEEGVVVEVFVDLADGEAAGIEVPGGVDLGGQVVLQAAHEDGQGLRRQVGVHALVVDEFLDLLVFVLETFDPGDGVAVAGEAGLVGLPAAPVVAGEDEGADHDEPEEQHEDDDEAQAEDVYGDFFFDQIQQHGASFRDLVREEEAGRTGV